MADMRFIDELISKYLQQTISEAETTELNKWIVQSPENKILFENLTDAKYISDELDKFYQFDESKGWEKVKSSYLFTNETAVPVTPGRIFNIENWKKIAAVAASILLIVSIGVFFYNANKTHVQSPVATVKLPVDVQPPQTNRATIILSNGQTILLDSVNNGVFAKQGNVNVTKTKDGQIVYTGAASETTYNTLTNPRGSTVINLTLSDGTKVWLNSESSLKYPIAFAGNERKVEVVGEAYFEVSKDKHKKFLVDAKGVMTEVLGTHFNVNSYSDEGNTKITLLEGSVKVTKGIETSLLKPGQQAQVDAVVKVVDAVDVNAAIAWKNGVFMFNEADLPTVMRQLERWYDIKVQFLGVVPSRIFAGELSRDLKLSQILKILKTMGLEFTMENGILTIKSD